jgi:signal transduction histidine kinase
VRSDRLLLAGFLLIAALFATTDLITMVRARAVRGQTDLLVRNMLESIELVGRMRTDLDRERLLLDAHILEHDPAAMVRIEQRLAALRGDYTQGALAYEPLAKLPGEEVLWHSLTDEVDALSMPLEGALAFSRANRDTEARAALNQLDDRFAQIDRDVDALIRLNRAQAYHTLGHLESLQRAAAATFGGLAMAGIALSLIVGARVTRLVQKRESQLARSTEELATRNRELDAFAGRVAHDLRGPLTAIGLAAARLEHPAGEPPAEVVGRLRRGVTRMEALIRDLLTLSRMAGDVHAEGGDPAQAAAQVRDDLQPRLEAEPATLVVDVEPANVVCGEGFLRQVLWNLADNSLKYRRADVKPAIEMWGRSDGRSYELRVSDNGMGMSPDETRRVFEPFYRALRTPEAPGTGLGLSIVKRVIEAAGGTIQVYAELGRGTAFVIALPLWRG